MILGRLNPWGTTALPLRVCFESAYSATSQILGPEHRSPTGDLTPRH